MEVAIPTSIPTSTTQVINHDIQPQICSHSHCGRPVGYGFPKNALCGQCMTMSYRPFPNTKHGSNGDINHTDPSERPGFSDVHWDTTMNDRRAVMSRQQDVQLISLPTRQVSSSQRPPLPSRRTASKKQPPLLSRQSSSQPPPPALPSFSERPPQALVQPRQLPTRRRVSNPPEHEERLPVARVLHVPSSSSGTPLLDHFNSKGELIVDHVVPAYAHTESPIVHTSTGASEGFVHPHPSRADCERSQPLNNIPTTCTRCRIPMPSSWTEKVCPSCRIETAYAGRPAFCLNYSPAGYAPLPVKAAPPLQREGSIVVTKTVDLTEISPEISVNMPEQGTPMHNSDITMDPPESEPDKVETIHKPPENAKSIKFSSAPNHETLHAGPSRVKRQKISHSKPHGSRKIPSSNARSGANDYLPPLDQEGDKKTSPALKLCSTYTCTGIISHDSSASRCLACVKRDWTSKRSKRPPLPSRASNANAGQKSGFKIVIPSPLKRQKVRKSVTWADDVNDPGNISSTDRETEGSSPASSLDNPDEISSNILNLASSSSHTEDGGLRTASNPETIDGKTGSNFHASQLPLPSSSEPTPPSDKHGSSTSPANPVGLVNGEAPLISPDTDPKSYIAGWNSDLSDLTDSEEGESDGDCSAVELDSESKAPPPTVTPTGLTIRIPARPGGIYGKKCATAKCDQFLAADYRWKSCIICRARSRNYQRKRQNIQGPHTRLDEEFLNGHTTGVAAASDFIEDASSHPKLDEADVTLVPNARLCSIRDCAYIIPPVDEYRWKMCALCQIRTRYRKLYAKSDQNSETQNDPPRPTRSLDAREILTALNKLPVRAPTPGRCRSIDCGVLIVTDSPAMDCTQCIGRRVWLMGKTSSPEGAFSAQPESAGGPISYPQYKCFTALLVDFRDRLSGFLKSQSIYYLHNASKPQLETTGSFFKFDGEFSVVSLDFDVVGRKEEIDRNAVRVKKEVERVGRMKFSPKRMVSVLDDGGIAVRFVSQYHAPVMQPVKQDDTVSVATFSKTMQGELEIAVIPDRSHRFLPGQKTIIRFRLMG